MSDSKVTSLQLKRIEKELKDIIERPPEKFRASPVKNNYFEWHFTMQGPEGSDFEQGIYHGKIELPSEYPIKPPNIYFLTPNGRFQIKTKICLSITKYHPENWNPSWTIRTMIDAIIQHFVVKEAFMAVGALDYSSSQIKRLAQDSHKWICDDCGSIINILRPFKREKEEKKEMEMEEEKEKEKQEHDEINIEDVLKNKFEFMRRRSVKDRLANEDMNIFNWIIKCTEAEMKARKSVRILKPASKEVVKEKKVEVKEKREWNLGVEILNLLIFCLIVVFVWKMWGEWIVDKIELNFFADKQ